MVDEIYDRAYQAHRAHMNRDIATGLSRFARAIGSGFTVLARRQFAAPWKGPRHYARAK